MSTKSEMLDSHGSYFIQQAMIALVMSLIKIFVSRLTKEAGVATIPVSAFHQTEKDVIKCVGGLFLFKKNRNAGKS
ncbi:MAG: hypothetical protein IPK57_15620 [Chitinophagaceae bacterium]|nr:hypothetical protein [Chitinophagaceae bacterium]